VAEKQALSEMTISALGQCPQYPSFRNPLRFLLAAFRLTVNVVHLSIGRSLRISAPAASSITP